MGETEMQIEKDKLLKTMSELSELNREFQSLKAYKETIEVEMCNNEISSTDQSEKFHNMESELEWMKIDAHNKDVSIVSLNKKLVEEKDTLAEYISKLNINLDETKKALQLKCEEMKEAHEENLKLVTQINIV